MRAAIRLAGVRKTFGEKVAVRDLDFEIPQGGLYGLIGPNGAGKTTTIRIVMSILFPDEGEVEVLGRRSALDAKDRIGYLPEERGVYKKMRVASFLRYIGRLKGLPGRELDREVPRWLERVELGEVGQKRCEELSKGMQQKVQFIAAVIHRPDLLILDEPFSGLDPVNMRLLRELVFAEHERGATIVFSTHVMVQAEQLCDHILMIHEGEKVLDEPMAAVRSRRDDRIVLFEPLVGGAEVEDTLRSLPEVGQTRWDGETCEVTLADGVGPERGIRALVASVPPARVELHQPSLEDLFVALVEGAR